MKTKVFRVFCIAGLPPNRIPQTPVKKVTVSLKHDVLQKTPIPEEKAKSWAMQILKSEIERDPQFKSGYHWEVESTEADLSEYLTPNLTSADGRAWLN